MRALAKTILIVEDDSALRAGLAFELGAEGYRILTAARGGEALTLLEEGPDLALLDVNLPDTDGFTLCSGIKAAADIPVVFLTARDLERDQLTGFERGADDYIVKPFSVLVLRRRIAAVLRRYSEERTGYSDGYLSIDFERFSASVGDKRVSFTPTEYKLLSVFIANAGKVLTRRLLLEKLWDNEGNFVDEHALTVNVNRLRSKLEDENHKYIRTVYGIGYLWAGERP